MHLRIHLSAALGLATVLSLSASRPALAAPAVGATPLGAQRLVSGISAQRTVLAEARLEGPATASSTPASSATGVDSPQGLPKLASRIEAVAGTDHLVGANGFLKQSSLFAEARYRLNEWLQLGASGAVRVQGDGNRTTDTAAQLLFGPTFNVGAGSGLQNAYFISPKLGPSLASTVVDGGASTSRLRLALGLTAGKRFALAEKIAFAPAIGVVWQAGYSPVIAVEPIAFSIAF